MRDSALVAVFEVIVHLLWTMVVFLLRTALITAIGAIAGLIIGSSFLGILILVSAPTELDALRSGLLWAIGIVAFLGFVLGFIFAFLEAFD